MASTKEVVLALLAGEKLKRKELAMAVISLYYMQAEFKTYAMQITKDTRLPVDLRVIGSAIQNRVETLQGMDLEERIRKITPSRERDGFDLDGYLLNKLVGGILD